MKNPSANLRAAINAGAVCTIVSVVAPSGSAAYFTDHDVPLTFGGNSYQPTPGLSRSQLKLANTTEVSAQNVSAQSVDLPDDELQSGLWDSAVVTVSLLGWQMVTPETMVVNKGTFGAMGWTDTIIQVSTQNILRNLGKQIGRQIMPTCRHALYDIGDNFDKIGACGIDPTGFTQTATVTAILTANLKFKITATTEDDDWASNGYVQWTSGGNNAVTNLVKIHSVDANPVIGEAVELLIPTTRPIQVGDTLKVLGGCDHTMGACFAKFSNQANFGGFPNMQPDVNVNINLGT
jgi:uncharacterized phage protein (TIGR02218 family)